MGGLKMIRQICSVRDPYLDRVFMVSLTILAIPGDEQICPGAGADRCINRTVSLARRINLIAEMLQASTP